MNTTSEAKNLELDKDYIDRDLSDKLSLLDKLTREKNHVDQQLQQASNNLELLSQDESFQRNENESQSDLIIKLQNEKRDLLMNLENLTM